MGDSSKILTQRKKIHKNYHSLWTAWQSLHLNSMNITHREKIHKATTKQIQSETATTSLSLKSNQNVQTYQLLFGVVKANQSSSSNIHTPKNNLNYKGKNSKRNYRKDSVEPTRKRRNPQKKIGAACP